MSHSPTDNEWIERYLLGKLTDTEVRDFNIRLEEDREFARKLRLIKTFPEMMSEAGRKEFERIQAETHAKEISKRSFLRKNKRFILWGLIAAVVIGISIVLYFFISGRNLKKEEKVVFDNPLSAPKEEMTQPKQPKDTIKKPASKEIKETVSQAIELITPANGASFLRKEQLMFTWKMKTDTFTRIYILSEATQKISLWRGIKPGINQFNLPGNTLFPGDYTWYVGTKNPSRKFTIK